MHVHTLLGASLVALSYASASIAPSPAKPPPRNTGATSLLRNSSYCPPLPATPSQQHQIWTSFLHAFYIEKDFVAAATKYIAEDYIQHTPSALSGRQASIDNLVNLAATGVNFTIFRTALDNGIGWVHFRADIEGAGEPSAVVDIVRFNGSCLQEHWDVMQQRTGREVNPLAFW